MSENIDKIFYINLDKRTDRREEIENELNNFNLPYERFNAFYYPDFCAYGCAVSHWRLLN